MLFNSFGFIFLFLPIVLCVFYLSIRLSWQRFTLIWLSVASLIFYAQWNVTYLPLLIGSICFNYLVGFIILSSHQNRKVTAAKIYLSTGIIVDLFLLGYYKYTDFGINTLNSAFHWHLSPQNIILPLGISFFTFTQIAYIVDTYKQTVKDYSFSKYCLFVTYFPHLIAGPILHHGDMIPQFNLSKLKNECMFQNIYFGLLIFIVGLFKKIMIADPLSVYASLGFDSVSPLTFIEAWITSLAYSFQLFFDFSGYSDMAVGLGLLFQTYLPINFNSPYRAMNIQDFWRRWHITLSNFLRDYVYIPLGGNRKSAYANLMITFLIGGLWHGAGWLFLIWGGLHGLALVIHRQFKQYHANLGNMPSWLLTFLFVNIAWIFFRATSISSALNVLRGMTGLQGFSLSSNTFNVPMLLDKFKVTFSEFPFLSSDKYAYFSLIISTAVAIILTLNSTHDWVRKIRPNFITLIVIILTTGILLLNMNKSTEFLYFNF